MAKKSIIFLVLNILFIAATLFLPLFGSQSIDFEKALFDTKSVDFIVFFDVRLPRVLFAFAVGAGLALMGAVFQGLLRNDLATPYTLGVSAGGAFGAVLGLKLNLVFSWFIFSSVSLFSISGSLIAVSIIFLIARSRYGFSIYTLILAGVAISFFFSSFNLFLHYLADFTETFRMIRWLMGSLDVVGWQYTTVMFVLLIIAGAYFIFNYKAFNILLTGHEMALSKGVDVKRIQLISFFMGSAFVGFIVAFAGPIGFIGLVIPHIVRLLFGANHKFVFIGSIITGGFFLAFCDTIARIIIAPAELPVGIITSMIGGPFFIYLLLRKKYSIF